MCACVMKPHDFWWLSAAESCVLQSNDRFRTPMDNCRPTQHQIHQEMGSRPNLNEPIRLSYGPPPPLKVDKILMPHHYIVFVCVGTWTRRVQNLPHQQKRHCVEMKAEHKCIANVSLSPWSVSGSLRGSASLPDLFQVVWGKNIFSCGHS